MLIEASGSVSNRPIVPGNGSSQIVRKSYPIETQPRTDMLDFSQKLAGSINAQIAGIIAGHMHNNSPTSEKGRRFSVRVAHPTSVYYIATNNALFVEWATQVPAGVKLHDFIRDHGNYDERFWDRTGDIWTRIGNLWSGHLGDITLREKGQTFRAALFDRLAASINRGTVNPETGEYSAATTLLNNDIVPITSDGYVVRFS